MLIYLLLVIYKLALSYYGVLLKVLIFFESSCIVISQLHVQYSWLGVELMWRGSLQTHVLSTYSSSQLDIFVTCFSEIHYFCMMAISIDRSYWVPWSSPTSVWLWEVWTWAWRPPEIHCTGCSWRLQRWCMGRIAIGNRLGYSGTLLRVILNRNSTNLLASCTSVFGK